MVPWGVTGREVVDETATSGNRDGSTLASDPWNAAAGESAPEQAERRASVSPETGDLSPITVGPTPEGLARAVTATSSALATTRPLRSHPAYRSRPPVMVAGDTTDVPDPIVAATPAVDVTLVLPPTRAAVMVAAPLAYYLPATAALREGTDPALLLDDERRMRFDDLQRDARTLLNRVFTLDSLVRREPDHPPRRVEEERDLLHRLDVDPDHVRSLSPAGRLDRYLTAWVGTDDRPPPWHLTTAVAPTPSAVPALPTVLHRLSAIVRPERLASRRSDLLRRTLSNAYRTPNTSEGASAGRSPPSVGWLGPGRPRGTFTETAAIDHGSRSREAASGPPSVVVVLGGDRIDTEHEAVARIYRKYGDCETVDVVRSPTRVRLQSVLETGYELCHFVGHCDDGGLRCTDGTYSPADGPTCGTDTFVLNACGSYESGLALLERGAVAGVVTHTDVLDSHAVSVGTALARLLVAGFSVQRALELARRRILMGQDYAAVGDATDAPWANRRPPGVLWIESGSEVDDRDVCGVTAPLVDTGEPRSHSSVLAGCPVGPEDPPAPERDEPGGEFEVTFDAGTIRGVGSRRRVPFDDGPILTGTSRSATLSREELGSALEAGSFPVVWAGDLYWSRGSKHHQPERAD